MSTIEVEFTWRWRWWARPLLWAWVAFARLGVARLPTRRDVSRMIVVSLAALALFACTPPVAPCPDASDAQALGDALPDGGICAAACANLRRLSCPEGLDPKCMQACTLNLASPVTVDPLSCWASAPTKEAARACGSATSGHLACAP